MPGMSRPATPGRAEPALVAAPVRDAAVTAVVVALTAGALAAAGDHGALASIQRLDDAWLRLMISGRVAPLTTIAKIFNVLGHEYVTLPVRTAIAGLLALRRWWWHLAAFAAAMVISEVLTGQLKGIYSRARPPGSLVVTSGPSFPSGHAVAASVTVVAAVIALVPAGRRRGWWRWGRKRSQPGASCRHLVTIIPARHPPRHQQLVLVPVAGLLREPSWIVQHQGAATANWPVAMPVPFALLLPRPTATPEPRFHAAFEGRHQQDEQDCGAPRNVDRAVESRSRDAGRRSGDPIRHERRQTDDCTRLRDPLPPRLRLEHAPRGEREQCETDKRADAGKRLHCPTWGFLIPANDAVIYRNVLAYTSSVAAATFRRVQRQRQPRFSARSLMLAP
jgi:hypothetical protein